MILFLIKLVTDKIACVMTIGMMIIIKVIVIMIIIIKVIVILLLIISELVPVGMTWIRGGGQSRAILLLAARFKHHCRHYDYHHHCPRYCRTLIS